MTDPEGECIKPDCDEPLYIGCHCRAHYFALVKARWDAYWARIG